MPYGDRRLRIQDSIYGTIDLSEGERGVIDSPSFQRLLSIKQLGYAYAVFPGGDYSRFSHSIGATHVMHKLLTCLKQYGGRDLSDTEQTIYRFAALIHDIGHYPYSHALEYAIRRRYLPDVTANTDEAPNFLLHEQVGAEILRLDEHLSKAIEDAGVAPRVVMNVLLKKDPHRHSELITSDVDADRMDYLLRTAHHTGLPYGHIDQDYIAREVRIDPDEHICWSERSLGAIDHLLLGRFYDYQQIVYNKTVVALEETLKDVVYAMTDPIHGDNTLDLSGEGIRKKIESGEWYRFDDHMVFEKIKLAAKWPTANDVLKAKCDALINRKPPRRVAECAALLSAKRELEFDAFERGPLKSIKLEMSKHFGISEDLIWAWTSKQRITSYKGSEMPTEDDEGTADLARVFRPDGKSTLAVLNSQSLVGNLCTVWRFTARLYVLMPGQDVRRSEMEKFAQSRMDLAWAEVLAGA